MVYVSFFKKNDLFFWVVDIWRIYPYFLGYEECTSHTLVYQDLVFLFVYVIIII